MVREAKYAVLLYRLVWGDYDPRFVGVEESLAGLEVMVRRDVRERLGEERCRIVVYLFSVVQTINGWTRNVGEVVAFGREEEVLRAVSDKVAKVIEDAKEEDSATIARAREAEPE
jgi:hypothetical protein